MKINAYAKINLTLDIVGLRDDGFHELRSVMVPISLCDVVTVTESDELAFDCNIKELCTADNLCVSAAKLFFATVGREDRVYIHLQKNIPFPAGLGGGSSDAAAVLTALNEAYGCPLSREELFSLAEKLGSDVPFCLLSRPALCEGRGERLTPIDGLSEISTVIAIGSGRLSTPRVFREYDSMKLSSMGNTERFLDRLSTKGICSALRFAGNDFEPVTDILSPETKTLRELLIKHGAVASHLSGSGPSVYGLFENDKKAEEAAEILKSKGYFAVCCKTLI